MAEALANLTRAAKNMKVANMKAAQTNTRAQSEVVGECHCASLSFSLLSLFFFCFLTLSPRCILLQFPDSLLSFPHPPRHPHTPPDTHTFIHFLPHPVSPSLTLFLSLPSSPSLSHPTFISHSHYYSPLKAVMEPTLTISWL